jgi:drug/metabolite transporter (DMT)-like permease
MAIEIVLLLLIMIAGTGGELCVARAMKTVGSTADFRPASIARLLARGISSAWMWLGISLMALAFFSLLEMLSRENVSFVVPVTALSYAFGALGGKLLLGEQVTRQRWAGVLLVCVGVSLVVFGKH